MAAVTRRAAVALAGLILAIPLQRSVELPAPRDPQMRRIVAEFQSASAISTRRFEAELGRAVAKCRRSCDRTTFIGALVDGAWLTEQKLSEAQEAAETRLYGRARDIGGIHGVLGAPGDLSRSVALVEMLSLRAAADVTESLAALNDARIGGGPPRVALLLDVRRLGLNILPTNLQPVGFRTVLTIRLKDRPTGVAFIGGSAPEGSVVTVTIVCGSTEQTKQAVANESSRWSVSFTLDISGPTTCTVTATTNTGTASRQINFL